MNIYADKLFKIIFILKQSIKLMHLYKFDIKYKFFVFLYLLIHS